MGHHKNNLSIKDLPTVRQLRAFTVLYETGNVSAAANILALTQPAVTVLLREMELKLGVRLFDRGPGGLRRTEAAAEAITYAQRVLGDLNEMRTNMQAIASGAHGIVRIAATSAVAQSLVPGLIQRFALLNPLVRVTVDDCAPHEFVERVASGRVHFGIGTLEASIPGLAEQVFMRDWLHAVAHKSLLAPQGKTITWKQVGTLPIIAVKPGYGVRRSIEHAAAQADISLNVVHEVALLSTALALAAQGLGVAILPGALPSRGSYPDLVSRRLTRPLVMRNLAIIHRKDCQLTPTAQAFVDRVVADSASD